MTGDGWYYVPYYVPEPPTTYWPTITPIVPVIEKEPKNNRERYLKKIKDGIL
jgi:hypothetical protein